MEQNLPTTNAAPLDAQRTADQPAEFEAERRRLLEAMFHPQHQADARRALNALYIAQRLTHAPAADDDVVARLRQLVAASMEGGLLRLTQRRAILEQARLVGLSEFQTHLLIAEVQFGEAASSAETTLRLPRASVPASRGAARLAGATLLGAALFLAALFWLRI